MNNSAEVAQISEQLRLLTSETFELQKERALLLNLTLYQLNSNNEIEAISAREYFR